MATMIPEIPRECTVDNHEREMFEELDHLPDDYFVFHSFSLAKATDNILRECEIDFVIFHRQKGIICLEAKAGQVDYHDGCWWYGSGGMMKHDGPYNQARICMHRLVDEMLRLGLEYELNHCKLMYAVWFPGISRSKLKSINLPSEADKLLTLTSDDFGHIQEAIDGIFSVDVTKKIKTSLPEESFNRIMARVLAPEFNLISIREAENNSKERSFKRMLSEQIALLNYLEEQKSAVINGLAGTGKTVMAVQKALRHAEKKEKVLFLCYNYFLKDYLRENYHSDFIEYNTIAGFACKVCHTKKADYERLSDALLGMYDSDEFEYQHVIIDEGQDFGKKDIEKAEVIDALRLLVLENKKHPGSFYMFYDKYQRIQSFALPKYVDEADCRLTLYRNCRNTENVASTSFRLLGRDQTPILIQSAIKGDMAEMGFAADLDETIALLNSTIDRYIADGYDNITILTCDICERSILKDHCLEADDKPWTYNYRDGISFTTCRKFKGLESDAVIVVDINKASFTDKKAGQLMYVGASRAKYRLCCIVNMTEDECFQVLVPDSVKLKSAEIKQIKRSAFKKFAKMFNAEVIQA